MKVLDENGLSCLKSIIKPKVFEKKKTATSGGMMSMDLFT